MRAFITLSVVLSSLLGCQETPDEPGVVEAPEPPIDEWSPRRT